MPSLPTWAKIGLGIALGVVILSLSCYATTWFSSIGLLGILDMI